MLYMYVSMYVYINYICVCGVCSVPMQNTVYIHTCQSHIHSVSLHLCVYSVGVHIPFRSLMVTDAVPPRWIMLEC